MVPLKALVSTRYAKGANLVSRFNGYNASKIIGSAAPGYSSSQAMAAMEEVAKEVLPDQMVTAWSGEAYQELAMGGHRWGFCLSGC